jgi:hypothetical protein
LYFTNVISLSLTLKSKLKKSYKRQIKSFFFIESQHKQKTNKVFFFIESQHKPKRQRLKKISRFFFFFFFFFQIFEFEVEPKQVNNKT